GLYRPRFGPDPFTGIFKTSSGDLTLPPPADKFSAKEVARFQQALSRLGYPLKVDGKYGNETKEAIRKLQLRNGYYDLNSLRPRPPVDLAMRLYGSRIASGELDDWTVSYLNLIFDVSHAAKAIYSMPPAQRVQALDRSNVIKGYADARD